MTKKSEYAKGGFIQGDLSDLGPPKILSEGYVVHHWNAPKGGFKYSNESLLKAMNQVSKKNLKEAFVLPLTTPDNKPFNLTPGEKGGLGAGVLFKVSYPAHLLVGAHVIIKDEQGVTVGNAVVAGPQTLKTITALKMTAKTSQTVAGVGFWWKDESCTTLIMGWKPYDFGDADLPIPSTFYKKSTYNEEVKQALKDMVEQLEAKQQKPAGLAAQKQPDLPVKKFFNALKPYDVSASTTANVLLELVTYAHEHNYPLMASFDIFFKGVIDNPFTDLTYIPAEPSDDKNTWHTLVLVASKVLGSWTSKDCPYDGTKTCTICTGSPKPKKGTFKINNPPLQQIPKGTKITLTKLDSVGNPISDSQTVEAKDVTVELGLPGEGKVSPEIKKWLDFLSSNPKGSWSVKTHTKAQMLAETFTPDECTEAAQGMQALYALKSFSNYVWLKGESILGKQALKELPEKPQVKVPLLAALHKTPKTAHEWTKTDTQLLHQVALETLKGGSEAYYKQVKQWLSDDYMDQNLSSTQYQHGKQALFAAYDKIFGVFEEVEDDELDAPVTYTSLVHPNKNMWDALCELPKNVKLWHPDQKAVLAKYIKNLAMVSFGVSEEAYYNKMLAGLTPVNQYVNKVKHHPNAPNKHVVSEVVMVLQSLLNHDPVSEAKKLKMGTGSHSHPFNPFNQPLNTSTFHLLEMASAFPTDMTAKPAAMGKFGSHMANFLQDQEIKNGVTSAKKVFHSWVDVVKQSSLTFHQKQATLKTLFWYTGAQTKWLVEGNYPLHSAAWPHWENQNLTVSEAPKKKMFEKSFFDDVAIKVPTQNPLSVNAFKPPTVNVQIKFADGLVSHNNMGVAINQPYNAQPDVQMQFPGTMQEFITNPVEQSWSSAGTVSSGGVTINAGGIHIGGASEPEADFITLNPGEQIILLGEPDEVRKIKVPKGTRYTHIKRQG